MKNSRPVLTILAVLLSVCLLCACLNKAYWLVIHFFNPANEEAIKMLLWGTTNEPYANISNKNEENLKLYETFNANGDMQLRSAKTKYKYKKPDPDLAKQGWTMKGEFDTAQTGFSTWNLITIRAGCGTGDTPNQINHQFSPGKVSKNKTSCKSKFFIVSGNAAKNGKTPKSAWPHIPSFGMFSARIKDGKLRFVYNIKKAKEGNQSISNSFGAIAEFWGKMGDTNKLEGAGFVNTKIKIDTEEKKADSMIKLKATKKGIKGKIKPSEQF